MRKIVLTGGGTAGHCIPNICLVPELKKTFDEIYYVGSENGLEKNIAEKKGLPFYSVSCAKLKRKVCAYNFTIPFKVFKGALQAKHILRELRPDVVFSKGGYVAVPVVLAAHQLKIPVITHESDYSLGLANRIISKYSALTLTAFPDAENSVKNGRYVGAPIRKFNTADKNKALSLLGFSGKKPVVAVFGGSLGSTAINSAVRQALNDILPVFDVLHITGKNNIDVSFTKKGYVQKEFMFDMENAYSVADVIVSRAGANSLFEILSLCIPSVIIPLPKGASRGDQLLNAEYFDKLGMITVVKQDVLTKDSLVNAVNSVYANRFNVVRKMSEAKIKDASADICKIINGFLR